MYDVNEFYYAVFQFPEVPEVLIKGVIIRPYRCYSNILCYEMITTCLPMLRGYFDIVILASSDKE